jgi:hypothetical protein
VVATIAGKDLARGGLCFWYKVITPQSLRSFCTKFRLFQRWIIYVTIYLMLMTRLSPLIDFRAVGIEFS